MYTYVYMSAQYGARASGAGRGEPPGGAAAAAAAGVETGKQWSNPEYYEAPYGPRGGGYDAEAEAAAYGARRPDAGGPLYPGELARGGG